MSPTPAPAPRPPRTPPAAKLTDPAWIEHRIAELDTHLRRIDRRQPRLAKQAADRAAEGHEVARWSIEWDARLRAVRSGERDVLARRLARLRAAT